MQIAVTYVCVSSLICIFASLPCGLFQRLAKVLVDFVIVEMCRNDIGVHVVGRMLHRTELVYFMIVRHDDDTARMLTGSSFHTGTVLSKAVCLEFIDRTLAFFKELHNVTVSSLVRHGTYSSCLENVLFTENRDRRRRDRQNP